MALINDLKQKDLERNSTHSVVDCTYSIVKNDDGKKMLQLDTYGSAKREIPGKKSQSLRFTPEALKQLKIILNEL